MPVNSQMPSHLKPTGDFALTSDWPYNSTAQDRLYKLYKTGGGTFDFVIGLEPPFTSIDQRVYIHKAIVAAASPVLRELIANSAGEWNFNLHAAKEDYGVVEAKQFKQLIEFIYTDKVKELEAPPTGNNNQEVYRGLAEGLTNLGKTFKVPRIEAYCASKTKGLDEDAEFSDEGHMVSPPQRLDRSFGLAYACDPAKKDTADIDRAGKTEGEIVRVGTPAKSAVIGKGNINFKSNIVKEVVAELKGKLVAELEKDLLSEIREEVNKSDLHGKILEELADKMRNSFNL